MVTHSDSRPKGHLPATRQGSHVLHPPPIKRREPYAGSRDLRNHREEREARRGSRRACRTGVEVKPERSFECVTEVPTGKIDTCQGRISAKGPPRQAGAAEASTDPELPPTGGRRIGGVEKTRSANARPLNRAPGVVIVFAWRAGGEFCF